MLQYTADSMKVLATLLVVGVMDDARADILGNGNLQLTLIESLSQVCLQHSKHHPNSWQPDLRLSNCTTRCTHMAWDQSACPLLMYAPL